MSDAKRDANRVPTMMGVSSVDGVTPLPIQVDVITGKLLAKAEGISSSLAPEEPAKRDANRVPGILGTSSTDGTTPIPLSVDENDNGLRIQGA